MSEPLIHMWRYENVEGIGPYSVDSAPGLREDLTRQHDAYQQNPVRHAIGRSYSVVKRLEQHLSPDWRNNEFLNSSSDVATGCPTYADLKNWFWRFNERLQAAGFVVVCYEYLSGALLWVPEGLPQVIGLRSGNHPSGKGPLSRSKASVGRDGAITLGEPQECLQRPPRPLPVDSEEDGPGLFALLAAQVTKIEQKAWLISDDGALCLKGEKGSYRPTRPSRPGPGRTCSNEH